MAFSVSKIHEDVHGSSRFNVLSCVADAATQAIATGFNHVYGVSYGPKSMTTASVKIAINVDAAGAASPGAISVTGAVNGDEFYLNVWGR